jgi:hypothetical protein
MVMKLATATIMLLVIWRLKRCGNLLLRTQKVEEPDFLLSPCIIGIKKINFEKNAS